MTVTPEDLVEAWHLVVADGAEPKSWRIPEPLWRAVQRAAEERAAIDAGDHLSDVADLSLLGTPVEVDERADRAPVLFIRRNGVDETVPIFGSSTEAEPPR